MQVRTFVPSLYDENTTANAIVSELGEAFFRRLQRRCGGREIGVPKPGNVTADCILAQHIGMDDAQALAGVLGGETVYISRGCYEHPRLGEVEKGVRAGLSNAEIAAGAGITVRHVRRLKNRLSDLMASPGAIIAAE